MKKSPLEFQRKSFRLNEVASRNSFSLGFIYKEINAGRLRARKAGSTTIVTIEDEQHWLESMPSGLREPAHLVESRAKRASRKQKESAPGEENDEHDNS